jgi:hypothetical protein
MMILLAAAVGAAIAGPADVQIASKRPLDFTPATPRAEAFDQANALRAAGLARTSLDRKFSDEGATGALGFLCGLQPSGDSRADSDPHGRFVGAKFSLAFR